MRTKGTQIGTALPVPSTFRCTSTLYERTYVSACVQASVCLRATPHPISLTRSVVRRTRLMTRFSLPCALAVDVFNCFGDDHKDGRKLFNTIIFPSQLHLPSLRLWQAAPSALRITCTPRFSGRQRERASEIIMSLAGSPLSSSYRKQKRVPLCALASRCVACQGRSTHSPAP